MATNHQSRSKIIILWIISVQFLAYLSYRAGRSSLDLWYVTLNRSPLTPPAIVFPVVWSILYVIIALVGWCIWENRRWHQSKASMIAYAVQMIANCSWTPLFFGLHQVGAALISLAVMIISTMIMIYTLWRDYLYLALMLVPYAGWLLFAAYLNLYIWLHN